MLEELGVCFWLQCLSSRVPGCNVVLVGAKCDLLEAKAMLGMAARIERACKKWLMDMASCGMELHIEVEAGVNMTSCARSTGQTKKLKQGVVGELVKRFRGKSSWPCDFGQGKRWGQSKGLLHRIVHESDTDSCRGTRMSIPRSWFIGLAFLEALGLGRQVFTPRTNGAN